MDDSPTSRIESGKLDIIGREARIEFGGLLEGVSTIAKVDTGAYTGGLHVFDIQDDEAGEISFIPVSRDNRRVATKKYRKKWVKASNGEKEIRYVISVLAKIDGFSAVLELTLADRSEMKYDMLIGRKNLANKFLVDVAKK